MFMASMEEILLEIMKLYNKQPRDWHISVNSRPDEHSNGNIFISNPSFGLWQLKLDSLFKPRSLGVGMKIGGADEASSNHRKGPSFGYRPLFSDQLERLKEQLLEKDKIDSVINEILQQNPISIPRSLEAPLSLQGPIWLSGDKRYISEKQRELDEKLRKDLRRLVTRHDQGLYYG